MRRLWIRGFMLLVGVAVFTVYAAGAVGGYLLVTWLLASPPDLLTALVAIVGVTVVAGYLSYRFGTRRLLAGLQTVELPRQRAPAVYRRLDRLCAEMDVRQPPILVADLGVPNALSLGGPRKGVVVLDRSLLSLLTVDELAGILAHELAHMETYDTFVQTLAVSLMRSLARALSKIDRATDPDWGLRSLLYVHGDERDDEGLDRLLSTHPPVEDRVDRLLDREAGERRAHKVDRLRP